MCLFFTPYRTNDLQCSHDLTFTFRGKISGGNNIGFKRTVPIWRGGDARHNAKFSHSSAIILLGVQWLIRASVPSVSQAIANNWRPVLPISYRFRVVKHLHHPTTGCFFSHSNSSQRMAPTTVPASRCLAIYNVPWFCPSSAKNDAGSDGNLRFEHLGGDWRARCNCSHPSHWCAGRALGRVLVQFFCPRIQNLAF